jgi:hypothetical protein
MRIQADRSAEVNQVDRFGAVLSMASMAWRIAGDALSNLRTVIAVPELKIALFRRSTCCSIRTDH